MSIYDDVANLQNDVADLTTRVETLETQIAGTSATMLVADTDLNNLTVGSYIIPNTSVSGSLLNKPANANTATGFIKVVEGGNSGQLVAYYFPCDKSGASYWQRAYYSSSWGDWHEVNVFDSGWIDLTLSGDVIAFNEEQKPRYRRIGKEVFLSGAVKNISAFNTLIATLPANYRPSKKVIIAFPSTGVKFSRISILTTGEITYEQASDNIVAAGNWHSIACNFSI